MKFLDEIEMCCDVARKLDVAFAAVRTYAMLPTDAPRKGAVLWT